MLHILGDSGSLEVVGQSVKPVLKLGRQVDEGLDDVAPALRPVAVCRRRGQEFPDNPRRANDGRATALFRTGTVAPAETESINSNVAGHDLHDKAIGAFRVILFNSPN